MNKNTQVNSGNVEINGSNNTVSNITNKFINQLKEKGDFDVVGFAGAVGTLIGSISPLFVINIFFVNISFSLFELSINGLNVGGIQLPDLGMLQLISLMLLILILSILIFWLLKYNKLATILSLICVLIFSLIFILIISSFQALKSFYNPIKLSSGTLLIFAGLITQSISLFKNNSNILSYFKKKQRIEFNFTTFKKIPNSILYE